MPKKQTTKKSPVKKATNPLSVSIVGVDGKSVGHMTLPAEVFDVTVSPSLLAQSVRVYLANQREGTASTKTRGEVEGSTKKIYRQKGTGKARHGAIRAPIFVGGGIVFGPKPRDYRLRMPKAMQIRALAGALTVQYRDGNVACMDGLETLDAKTKLFVQALSVVGMANRTLLVLSPKSERTVRACRNIDWLDTIVATNLAAYDVMSHKKLIMMKDAVPYIKTRIIQKT